MKICEFKQILLLKFPQVLLNSCKSTIIHQSVPENTNSEVLVKSENISWASSLKDTYFKSALPLLIKSGEIWRFMIRRNVKYRYLRSTFQHTLNKIVRANDKKINILCFSYKETLYSQIWSYSKIGKQSLVIWSKYVNILRLINRSTIWVIVHDKDNKTLYFTIKRIFLTVNSILTFFLIKTYSMNSQNIGLAM